jgi:PST family polysaccharide transporter
VQRLSVTRENIKGAFAISLYTGLAASLALFAAAPLIAALFKMDGLTPFVRFLSGTLLLNSLSAVPAALMQREYRFRAIAVVELGSFTLGFGLIALLMAERGFGAWSLAVGQAVQALARTAVFFAVRKPPLGLSATQPGARQLLNVGGGFSAGQVGNYVATQVDYLVVGRWLGAETLGYYNRAYQFFMLPAQLFGTAISTVLFPSIASIQQEQARVARAYLRALGCVAMLTLPTTGVIIVLAPEIVNVLLGAQWTSMITPFQILLAGLLFRTSYKVSDAVSLAMGSMYERARRQWIYAAAVAGGALAGTAYGLAGVAIGVSAAVVLNFLMLTKLAQTLTNVTTSEIWRVHSRHLRAALLITLPTEVVAELLRWLNAGGPLILLGAGVTATGVTAFLWFGCRSVFGDEGAWLHDLARTRLGPAFRKMRR